VWLLKGINQGVKCEMLFAEIKEAQYILTRILRTNGSGFIFRLNTPNKISKDSNCERN